MTTKILIANITSQKLDIPVSDTLTKILGSVQEKGHRGLIVGGAVRDALMGEKPKDIDVEVYGPGYEELSSILAEHGKVNIVGKNFGVIKLTDADGQDYDFSLPRTDNKNGVGHKDFDVSVNPALTPKEAASRRDFTINSMAYDPLNGELHDYFGGQQDLENKVLRHTSEAFAEDPLRVLRGMQFASRFGMTVDPQTAKLSESISDEFPTIPKERISEEFMKLATKGKEPGRAIQYLADTGWSKNFPELHALHSTPQDPEWHPEGNVAVHTGHAMDAAARIADREGLTGDDRAVVVLGAMAHDLGKATHTQTEGERITSHGHDRAGGPLARSLMERIGIKPDITDRVVPIVESHMQHINFTPESQPRAVRRLADRVHPASLRELGLVMEADHSGRPPLPGGVPEGAQHMLRLAEESQVTHEKSKPIIQGRHVMPYFDEPGKHIGDVVKAAYQAQLDGEFSTPDQADTWLKNYMSSTKQSKRYSWKTITI